VRPPHARAERWFCNVRGRRPSPEQIGHTHAPQPHVHEEKRKVFHRWRMLNRCPCTSAIVSFHDEQEHTPYPPQSRLVQDSAHTGQRSAIGAERNVSGYLDRQKAVRQSKQAKIAALDSKAAHTLRRTWTSQRWLPTSCTFHETSHILRLALQPSTFMKSVDSQNQCLGGEKRGSSAPWTAKLKSRDFLEVAITYGVILLALWTPIPIQNWLFWITLAWVVLATIASGADARRLGFRPSQLWQSLWIAGIALLAAAIAVWIAAQMHALRPLPGVPAASRFLVYPLWALLQQFLLQDFFLLRLLRLLPTKSSAITAAAVLFASAHIPNPLLVVATLLWGAAACALFLRYRDLYSLGIAHGVLGTCLAITVPNAVQHQMRVGLGYLQSHQHSQPHHRSQTDHIVSTEAWVMADAIRRCPSLQALP
jgi:hypothetical protein